MTIPNYGIIWPVRRNTVKHIITNVKGVADADTCYRTLCGTIVDVRLPPDSPMIHIYRHCKACGIKHNRA